MDNSLTHQCSNPKANREEGFKKWMGEVKRIDNMMRSERREFKLIAKENRKSTHKSNLLGEPSNRANAPMKKNVPHTGGNMTKLPKLTEGERHLLFDNEGCLKCHCFFVGHRSTMCPNKWPSAAGYRALLQKDVDHACPGAKAIASIGASTSDPSDVQNMHPLAAVLGSSTAPTAYLPTNGLNMIERGDKSILDNSVSTSSPVKPKPPEHYSTDSPLKAGPEQEYTHFHWKCLVVGGADITDQTPAMIDNGSHKVLVDNDFISSSGLKHRNLYKPENIKLAMTARGDKKEIMLMEYVKLKLQDPSGQWTSKTVCAVISPKLCSPILLGLPFLVHSNIVIDHADQTVIDKVSGFDLMNPCKPETPAP
jgi:hypothetical protein